MELPPPSHTPPAASPQTPPHPSELDVEVKDEEPVSSTQQEEDVQFKLETEITQQVMYNHEKEVLTRVCGRSAPGVSFTGIIITPVPTPSICAYTFLLTPLSLLLLCVFVLFSPIITFFCMTFSTTELVHFRSCYCGDVGCCSGGQPVNCAAFGEAVCQCEI